MAVVAVARKLSELVWHLLTKQEDYLYEKPHRTMDKRSNVRKLARRKTNREQVSAAAAWTGRPVLYGSGLAGKSVKRQIARLAAEEAEAIYRAVICQQQAADSSDTRITTGFDPTRPKQTDRHELLRRFAEKVAQAQAAGAVSGCSGEKAEIGKSRKRISRDE